MNSILVIGAGKFGRHLAMYLCDMGNEVMLVDKNEKLIDEFSHRVTTAEIGDYTVRSNLEALGVEDYDYVFVCTGDFQDSLVMVDYLKELNARCIIAKANSRIHEKFLLKNGADRVIYPERDIAYKLSVAYSNNNIYDFINLSDDVGIYEIKVPDSWIGKSLAKLNVRRMHNINVIGYRDDRDNKIKAVNNADYVFCSNQHIMIMGDKNDVRKITKK